MKTLKDLPLGDFKPKPYTAADTVIELNGAATGADLTVWFELTTLYPALSHALGNDVMIDLRGIDQPATMRSADSGDLTTLVMPCQSPRP